ncbi:MAG: hypothetical protein IJA10_15335 [Lachnospiraceae bacterium]|nr:hypothetical protein [Lachnospiraceae bacterium]
MTYKYQKITEEEEASLREKYEIAVNIAEVIKNTFEDPMGRGMNPFTNVDFFKFNDKVVQDEEKKVCLMKSGYFSKNPEYRWAAECTFALFLFIEEKIVIAEINDYAKWVEIYQIFVPTSLAEKEDEIKKMIEDTYIILVHGEEGSEMSIRRFYYNFFEYTIYDKEMRID